MSLSDYEQVEPLRVGRGGAFWRPHHETGENTIVGFYATSNRGRAYLTYRERSRHYYRKAAGYAVSDEVLSHLFDGGVKSIIVVETDTDVVYEYDAALFRPGSAVAVRLDHDDAQTCVPTRLAREWDANDVIIQT
jgi:hypothetical protein